MSSLKRVKTQDNSDATRKPCVFVAPKNNHGFIVYHARRNNPIPEKQLQSLYENILGPVLRAAEQRNEKDEE